MIGCIDAHRDTFGVEPTCDALQIAPSTYWAAKRRAPCARAHRDAELAVEIKRVHGENFGVYGARKVCVVLCGLDPAVWDATASWGHYPRTVAMSCSTSSSRKGREVISRRYITAPAIAMAASSGSMSARA
jgi:hypothetical protein